MNKAQILDMLFQAGFAENLPLPREQIFLDPWRRFREIYGIDMRMAIPEDGLNEIFVGAYRSKDKLILLREESLFVYVHELAHAIDAMFEPSFYPIEMDTEEISKNYTSLIRKRTINECVANIVTALWGMRNEKHDWAPVALGNIGRFTDQHYRDPEAIYLRVEKVYTMLEKGEQRWMTA